MESATKIGSTVQANSALLSTFNGTLGRNLARRFIEISVKDIISVLGNFNLTLLDHFIAEPQLNFIGRCNELNTSYAADSYMLAKDVGACVIIFTFGGLSVLNTIARANSENLSLICVVRGSNSNDFRTNQILHHTIWLHYFSQELHCFQMITCFHEMVNNLDDAHELIDIEISIALKESKSVYISISCNLPGIPHPTFARDPIPFSLAPKPCYEYERRNGVSKFILSVKPDINASKFVLDLKDMKKKLIGARIFNKSHEVKGNKLGPMEHAARDDCRPWYPHFVNCWKQFC